MKTTILISRWTAHVCGTAVLALALSLSAQSMVRYDATAPGGGSKLKVDGTSTIHDWTIETSLVGGYMELDPEFDKDLKTPKSTPKVQITLQVRSLKSGKSAMDNVTYDAMKQTDHPKIEYRLLDLSPKAGGSFEAKGALTVSGTTITNTMPVAFERLDESRIKVTGSTSLKMTSFGIKPPAPALALGMIKTGDDVKVSFEWVAAKKTEPAK